MIELRDCIDACFGKRQREIDLDDYRYLVHHRISFARDDGGGGYWDDVTPISDADLDGPAVAARFRDVRRADGTSRDWRDRPGAYTGGRLPYHFIGRADGVIDQCTEVGELGPHARAWSRRSIAIAWVGDFRRHDPTPAQVEAAVEWSALWLAWGIGIRGHDELPGGSADPAKRCPGPRLDISRVRDRARGLPANDIDIIDAERALIAAGVVF